jgi:twinkle protein
METSKFVKHLNCEHCGSSDGNSLYDDGDGKSHYFCHVCQTWEAGDGFESKPIVERPKMQIKGEIKAIEDRGILRSSAEFYGVTDYLGNHYYPYADETGAVVAAKVRNVANKDFHVEGQWNKATLFGQQKFNKGGMYVTIVEGELDALAAFQMTGSKYPVVSVRNGAAAALKDCKAQYEWLDSFETIVVCFDADEPGQKAAAEVAELFGSKVKIFKASNGYKDACDYLKDGSVTIFTQDWWKAQLAESPQLRKFLARSENDLTMQGFYDALTIWLKEQGYDRRGKARDGLAGTHAESISGRVSGAVFRTEK